MRTKRLWMIVITATLLVSAAAPRVALAEVPAGPPVFTDPLDIDNAYHPFVEYRIRLYEVQQGHTDGHVMDVFTDDTRTFTWDGSSAECACLEEWEFEDGEIVEISKYYFAQADDGTVYYFGELVDIYEDGVVVSNDGSWVVGALAATDPEGTASADEPAVFMPADPEIGDVWKPENLPDDGIEEFDEALKFKKWHVTASGKFDDVLEVREENPDIEYKWYAADVGFVEGKDHDEILSIIDIIDSANADDMIAARNAIRDELLEDA